MSYRATQASNIRCGWQMRPAAYFVVLTTCVILVSRSDLIVYRALRLYLVYVKKTPRPLSYRYKSNRILNKLEPSV